MSTGEIHTYPGEDDGPYRHGGDTSPVHVITIDEQSTLHGSAFKAFCTDSCGWSEKTWHHPDSFAEADDEVSAVHLAISAAESAGVDHIIRAEKDAAWKEYAASRYR